MSTILLGILVFVSAMAIDWANTRYVISVGERAVHKAALWSVAQWMASLVGFVVALKITLWMLPIEAAGLYAGTVLSLRNAKIKE